jgi:hypothetical protein
MRGHLAGLTPVGQRGARRIERQLHSAVVVALEIPCRDPLEVGAAHIAAHRTDETVPAPTRLKKCCGCDVGRMLRKRVEPLKKSAHPRRVKLHQIRNAQLSVQCRQH